MMDEFTADALVNRDEPIPVVILDAADDVSVSEEEEYDGERDRLRKPAANMKENVRKVQRRTAETGSSMQDRLLEKYALLSLALAFTC